MKKTILKSVLVAFLATISFSSCSNDDDAIQAALNPSENTITSKPPPPGLAVLTYREGGVLVGSTVSNPFAKAASQTIFGVNGSADVIEIRLTSLVVGVYTIGGSNKFFYKKPSTTKTWTALSGTVTITSNGSGLLSGHYNMSSGTGIPSVNSVSGTFDSIPIQ